MVKNTSTMLLIKLSHSYLVSQYCRNLALHLGWQSTDINTMELIGYLHDYGSIIEILETGSFLHMRNHGYEAYQTLKNSKFHDILTHEHFEAIRYHNNPNLMNPDNKYLKVLRDADKLAILELTNDLINKGELDWHCEVYLECKAHIYCKNILSWFADINYEWTVKKIDDMKIKERLEQIVN